MDSWHAMLGLDKPAKTIAQERVRNVKEVVSELGRDFTATEDVVPFQWQVCRYRKIRGHSH